jgi:uncharacterized protein YdbL (DUF1318 family)
MLVCAALLDKLGTPISSSAVTITVDFAAQERPMSHRANGYLATVE